MLEAFSVKGTEILISSAKLTSSSYQKEKVTVFSTEVTILSFEFVSGTKAKETPEKEEKSNKK